MKEAREEYAAKVVKKYSHKGRAAQQIQAVFDVSRRTAYYDINKVCKNSTGNK